jgi:hypothetical protein
MSGKELIVERSSRLVARNQVDGNYQKTFAMERKASKRVPKENFVWEFQKNLACTFTQLVNLSC